MDITLTCVSRRIILFKHLRHVTQSFQLMFTFQLQQTSRCSPNQHHFICIYIHKAQMSLWKKHTCERTSTEGNSGKRKAPSFTIYISYLTRCESLHPPDIYSSVRFGGNFFSVIVLVNDGMSDESRMPFI